MAGTKLSADLVDKLLDKLGTDDNFRTQFGNDPKGALKSLGASDDVECGGCMSPKNLASKQQLQQSRQRYRDALLGTVSQQVFNLES